MKYRILLIEDEEKIANNIAAYILNTEYMLDIARSGERGLELWYELKYDLVLLDLMLPRIEGTEVLREIRKQSDVPVIVISALTDEFIQNDLYQLTVDDFVTKPFSLKILIHKIRAVFRRVYGEKLKEIQFKNVRLIANNYEVYENDKLIKFTRTEFELLQLLMMNQGKVFTRDQLLTQVLGNDSDYTTINVHIRNIRNKLTQNIIQTIQGIGYKVGE